MAEATMFDVKTQLSELVKRSFVTRRLTTNSHENFGNGRALTLPQG